MGQLAPNWTHTLFTKEFWEVKDVVGNVNTRSISSYYIINWNESKLLISHL